jgi:acyl-CoA reductase-like NAD-dependent aldehyde dehydrogenase
MMREVRYRIYDMIDEIVETVAEECGKPRYEAFAHEVAPTMMQLLYMERIAGKVLRPERSGPLMGPLVGVATRIQWRPFGVVGCITPWNYPITNTFLATAGPLFAGNAVVIKPSEVTPRCGELIRKILEPLPPGVASVVQGDGSIGAALVDAPCDKISFVGSPVTGRKICEAAAKHLTPVVMELGGKDAAIVLDDADVEYAASGLVWGSFFNAGQTCYSVERIFVADSVADRFKERFLDKLSQVRNDEDGEIGSLTFSRQLDTVDRQVSEAIDKGASVLAGATGRRDDGSLWYAPTVLEGVTDDMEVCTSETFGPVVTLTRVADEDEAVRRANEAVNLTASVWTSDASRARSVGARLRAGTITINDVSQSAGAPWSSWGGVGESGFGRLNGKLGIREFCVPVSMQKNLMPGTKRYYWYPYTESAGEVIKGLTEVLGAPSMGAKLQGVKRLARSYVRSIKEKI